MNASKQYRVSDWVKNTKADKETVRRMLLVNGGQVKIARDLLARRRWIAHIKGQGY